MIYTNDEADKSTRQKHFYLSVYIAPVVSALAICGLVYWAVSSQYLAKTDAGYGYYFSLTPAFLLYGFNRRNWLKMPDGSYHNIKGIQPTPRNFSSEPAEYEAEYYYSKIDKAIHVIIGLITIGFSVWLWFRLKSIFLPITTNMMGLFLLYTGLTGLLDRTAKLKIAKNGLWTHKLGFVNWDDINYADVVQEKSDRDQKIYLEIRLKGTIFEDANVPDEKLYLNDLKGREYIETVINNSIFQYNQQKK